MRQTRTIHYLLLSMDTPCGRRAPAMTDRSLITCKACIQKLAKWNNVPNKSRAAWLARTTGA